MSNGPRGIPMSKRDRELFTERLQRAYVMVAHSALVDWLLKTHPAIGAEVKSPKFEAEVLLPAWKAAGIPVQRKPGQPSVIPSLERTDMIDDGPAAAADKPT